MSGKTPLLLVPGVLCDASLWAHQTHHLADIAEMTIVETTQDADIGAMVDRPWRRRDRDLPSQACPWAVMSRWSSGGGSRSGS